MSTLAVNAITNATGGNTATINGMTPTAQSLQGFRNRLINAGMVIDQRNNGASVTVATGGQTYITDRWVAYNSSGATQSFSQEAISNAGFTRALRCTITNAVASGASAFLLFGQRIEGFNVSDLAWGTASAQSVTVSFRVFTSLAGTYGGIIRNGANNRFYAFSFTVSANTWTQVTQTIAGDTSGTWATDNSTGLDLIISMGCGTSFQGATGSWGSTQILGASGQTQLNATAGATFSITGVQLEAGSVATPFERRPYGTELMLCQRYCYVMRPASASSPYANGHCWQSNAFYGVIQHPVQMRTSPIVSIANTTNMNVLAGGSIYAATDTQPGQINSQCWEILVLTSGMTVGFGAWLRSAGSGSAPVITVSAEL